MDASRNTKIGAIAVTAVALVAAGGAFAAGKYHGSKAAARGGLSAGSAASQTPGTAHDRRGFGFGRGFGRGGDLATAATYLGVSESDLQTGLQSGKTLAQIANATNGRSSSGLIAALVAAAKTRLETAVTARTLTQAQADQFAALLKERITDMVNGVRPTHGGFGRPGGFGGPGSGSSPGGGFQPTPSTHI